MNRESIIEEFTTDIKKFKRLASNIAGTEDADDLFQEVALMVLEFSEDRLISYYNPTQGLKPIFLRMLCNQYRSKTSKFHKDYRKQEIDLRNKTTDIILNAPQSEDEPESMYFEKIALACKEIYDESESPELAELQKIVWELYIETGSLRKTLATIPEVYKDILDLKAIHNIVKNFQTTIKSRLTKEE